MKYKDPVTGEMKTLSVKAADTLPIGTIVDYDGDTVPDGWEEVSDYSEDEIDTGQKWIDGKPIYRKVVDIGALPNSEQKIINHNINMETPIRCSGICYNASASMRFTLPMGNIDIWVDVNQIVVKTTTDRTNTTGKAIIEYTKTTDEGGNS